MRRLLGLGRQVAQAEWTRHRREFGAPLLGHRFLFVVSIALALGLGWLAYSLGREVASGQPLPTDALGLLVGVAFAGMVWRSSRYTHVRFERMEPAMLLTAVPARTAALGLLGFVYARLLTVLMLPTLGVTVGLVVGLQSLPVALTTGFAVTGMAALAVAVGTTARLLTRVVALRLVRLRGYRDLLVVFGWIPLMIGYMLLQELSLSEAPIVGLFGTLPVAWFVDLALVAGPEFARGSPQDAAAALGVLVVSIPALTAGTARLARRTWESEPVSSTGTHGSHTLVGNSWVDWLLGGYVSRPVRTVARERWLMERRVQRGLLSVGYVLLVVGVLGLPVILFAGARGFLLLIAIALGLAAGVAFGSDPVGTEYRTLPMVFTAVTGRQFVGGLVLAVSLIGMPLVVLVTVPVGVLSVVGPLQSVLIALVGVAVCACTASVALAVGLGVDRDELALRPFFFTDVPIYAEEGVGGFRRLGSIFAAVLLGTVPAFVGNAPVISTRVAALGVSPLAVQLGSLLLTILLVAALTRIAFRRAVRRFRDYQIG